MFDLIEWLTFGESIYSNIRFSIADLDNQSQAQHQIMSEYHPQLNEGVKFDRDGWNNNFVEEEELYCELVCDIYIYIYSWGAKGQIRY